MDKLDIAQRTAQIILERSFEDNQILYVGLYGSVLWSDNPEDLDLFVIHDGSRILPSYAGYETGMPHVSPDSEGNKRISSTEFLKLLEWRKDSSPDYSVLSNVSELVGSQSIDELYDLNALDVTLLMDEAGNAEKIIELRNEIVSVYGVGENSPDAVEMFKMLLNNQRSIMIGASRGTSYWHTALSECMLYDLSTKNFSTPLEELFPKASGFFPSEPPYVRKE